MLTFTAAVVLALLATAVPSAAMTIELKKRDLGITNSDGSVNLEGLETEATRLLKKYERTRKNWRYHAFGEDPTVRSSKKKRGILNLVTQDTAVWTGTVTIGTPAQSFNMYFDTGSSDFTVSSTACSSSSCGTKNRYNVASSSTAVKTSKTITTSFVDGTSSSGTLVDDTVGIAGLTATGQDIIAATSLSSTVADLESDGLMGLAYPSLSQALSSSLPFTLYKQSQGGRPQWFSLNLKSSGTSQIVFGGYNRAKIGTAPTRWFTSKLEDGTTSHTYWQIGGSTPYVNGAAALSTRVNHILDSGTTLIVAPPTAAAAFWATVPGSKVLNSNYWTFPCASAPAVSFSFARITTSLFGVAADDFNLGYLGTDPTRCVGAVIAQNLGLGTSWILGDSFMQSWIIIHDVANNLIGIATPR